MDKNSQKQMFFGFEWLKHFQLKPPRCTMKVIQLKAGDNHEQFRQFRIFWFRQVRAGL